MATPDIKVKMGVDGIAKFKSDLAQADQSVKTLDSELKLAEANYKKTGNAMTYMREKSRIVSQQIKEQQNAVKAAESALKAMKQNGADPASVSYQKMAQQLAQAKAKLVTLETQTKNIKSTLKETTDESKGFQDQLNKIAKFTGFNALATGFKGVASVVTSCVNTIKSAIQSAINAEVDAANQADEIATKARNYGVSTQEWQQVELATKLVSDTTSADVFYGAQNKLLKQFDFSDPWINVGGTMIPILNGNGSERGKEQVFWDAMSVLGDLSRSGQTDYADQVAQSIFGRGFSELRGYTEVGAREAWEAAKSQANTNTEEEVNNLVDLNNEIDILDNKLNVFVLKLASKFAGASGEGVDSVGGLIDYMTEWLDTPEAQQLFDALNKLITDAAQFMQDWIKQGGISKTIETIGNVVKWIYEFITGEKIPGDDGITVNKDENGQFSFQDVTPASQSVNHPTIGDAVTAVEVGAAALAVGKTANATINVLKTLGIVGSSGATTAAGVTAGATAGTTALSTAGYTGSYAMGSSLGATLAGGAGILALGVMLAQAGIASQEAGYNRWRNKSLDQISAYESTLLGSGIPLNPEIAQAYGISRDLYLNNYSDANATEMGFYKWLYHNPEIAQGFYATAGISGQTQQMIQEGLFDRWAVDEASTLAIDAFTEVEEAVLADVSRNLSNGGYGTGLLSGLPVTAEQWSNLVRLDSLYSSGTYLDENGDDIDAIWAALATSFGDRWGEIEDQLGTGIIPYLNSTWFADPGNFSGATVNGDQYNTEDNSVTVQNMTVYTTESGSDFITGIRDYNLGNGES